MEGRVGSQKKHALEVREVTFGYGDADVVVNVNVSVLEGEVVAIVGPNGSGKSTLLKGIAGLLPVRSGKIYLADRDGAKREVSNLVSWKRVRAGMGVVPQIDNVFRHLNVGDNLDVGYWSRDREFLNKREGVFGRFWFLRERLLQKAGSLSGGERQLLALARVLLGEPRLLVLDEPSAGLSPRAREHIFNVIGELRDEGLSVLIVEQNVHGALSLADYGYVLVAGSVRREGSAQELLGDEELAEAFFGGSRSD